MPTLTNVATAPTWVTYKPIPFDNGNDSNIGWITVTASGSIANGSKLLLQCKSPTESTTYYTVRQIFAVQFIEGVYRDHFQVPTGYEYRLGVPEAGLQAGDVLAIGIER